MRLSVLRFERVVVQPEIPGWQVVCQIDQQVEMSMPSSGGSETVLGFFQAFVRQMQPRVVAIRLKSNDDFAGFIKVRPLVGQQMGWFVIDNFPNHGHGFATVDFGWRWCGGQVGVVEGHHEIFARGGSGTYV